MLLTGLPPVVSSILKVLTPITLPSRVISGPPLLPGIYCSIGLQKVDIIYGPDGRDDASGYRQAVSNPAHEGVSECEHLVSRPYSSPGFR